MPRATAEPGSGTDTGGAMAHDGIEAMAGALIARVQGRLARDGAEVDRVLRSVAAGDIVLVEAITDEERGHARRLFGAVADLGVRNVAARMLSMVRETLAASDRTAARVDPSSAVPWLPLPPQATPRQLARLGLLLIAYVFSDEFHMPQAETGVYEIDAWQKIRWLYRHWFNQLETAEQGSGLEAFFRTQTLDLPTPTETTRRLTLTAAGDLLAVDVLTPENTEHLFDGIVDFFRDADIVSANLEATVDEHAPIGRDQRPGQAARMNTSRTMFDKYRHEAGINYFAVATNHAFDHGVAGLHATLDVLDGSGARHSGTARSAADQEQFPIIEAGGVRVALLSYTFDLNGFALPPQQSYLVNVVRFNDAEPAADDELIRSQVESARSRGADHIVAYCHWGWEFEMYPHARIREAARRLVEMGVDTILGNHPHVPQPAELIERAGRTPALVVYAFGDFVSYHPESRNSKLSYIVKFDIAKGETDGRAFTFVDRLKTLPVYIANARRADGGYDCRIVGFRDVLADPDAYGLTELEKEQLPHLRDTVWHGILSGLSRHSV